MKFSELKYERPNMVELKKVAKKMLKDLKKAKTYEEARTIYLNSQNLMSDISVMFVLCHIHKDMDTSNEFYVQEERALQMGMVKLVGVSKALTNYLLNNKFKESFVKEFGTHWYKDIEIGKKFEGTKAILHSIKENEWVNKYSKAVASCKVNFNGEECNFYGLLKHMKSSDRNVRKAAFEEWAKLYEGVSNELDDVYDKLIELRNKSVKMFKYNNFVEMSYDRRSRYDYNADDIKVFRDAICKYIVPVVDELMKKQAKTIGVEKLKMYDEGVVFADGAPIIQGNKDELVEKTLKMYKDLSKETGEFFQFMVDGEFFDLETRPNKRLGGYCTSISKLKAPFIFSNFNGTTGDLQVLTHEAGHAFEYYVASRNIENQDLTHSTSEINEIHSMAMEIFTYPYMDDFFDSGDKYRYEHLVDSLAVIPYMACVDEFQHEVYLKNLNREERYALWHALEQKYMPWRDYDGNEFLEKGGYWMQKQHIFMYPFYYIDYALAQICAFQFLGKINENKEQAWKDYYNLCLLGGTKGYFELLKSAGLDNPFKEETIENVMEIVKKELAKYNF